MNVSVAELLKHGCFVYVIVCVASVLRNAFLKLSLRLMLPFMHT